ncbi:hypothetical protein [Chitinimonas sp. BJYL2]|uniref:hypothetical protein n=1 Tax=Chitinimonas sp. BJYL2 TaxID=2976696 RepID=UPI0022B34BB8|nr:hypothetical protein [Chitinimonas sp. BJYL2]
MQELERLLRPRRPVPVYLIGAIVLLMGVSIWLATRLYDNHQAVLALEIQVQAHRAKQLKPTVTKPSNASLATQQQWQALAAERSFAWQTVFGAIEGAAKADVELLEFVPDKRNGKIVLRGEARDRKALLDYVTLLAAQPGLVQVHLVREQVVMRERLETVEFEVRSTLKTR